MVNCGANNPRCTPTCPPPVRSMAASSSSTPEPVCTRAAIRTPSGATARPVTCPPPNWFTAGYLVVPSPGTTQMLSFCATQRSSMRSQLIAVMPGSFFSRSDVANAAVVPRVGPTYRVLWSGVGDTPATKCPSGETAAMERAGVSAACGSSTVDRGSTYPPHCELLPEPVRPKTDTTAPMDPSWASGSEPHRDQGCPAPT